MVPGFALAPGVSVVGAASVDAVGGAVTGTAGASGGMLATAGAAGSCDARTVDTGAGSFLENMTVPMTIRNATGIIE
jgi:hypothetical protein